MAIMFSPNIAQASAKTGYEESGIVTENVNDIVEMDALAEQGLDFADNLVTVTLAKQATWQNYSVDNFADVKAIALDELTSYTSSWVRNKEMRIPTQQKMRVNLDSYRRIFSITLAEKSRESVLAAVEILQKRDDIQTATPSYFQRIQSVSANDTFRNDQWGINNANINEAWHLSTGNSTVIVGVLDSGIDGAHPDLTDRIHRDSPHNNSTTLHRDFTIGAVNGTVVLNPTDPNGHGTHVGGTIGAQGNNGTGVVGVAWDIRLVSLRVFDANGSASTHDWLIRAINYAASINLPIVNYSGGGTNRNDNVRNAIDAYDGLFVTSSGNSQNDNDGSSPNFPATFRLDNLVSVGSINSSNERSWFSNWGDTTVDIWAPGSHIYSTFPTALCNAGKCDDPNNEHIHRANGYHSMSGTSMASPHIAGVAALMLSANPNLTAQQLRTNLLNNSSALTITVPDPGFWPWQWNDTRQTNVRRLNAKAAVSAIATFDTRVLSDTTIEVRGTFGRQLPGAVAIPETLNGRSVTTIAASTFSGQTGMSQISIPSSVTHIGNDAFKNTNNALIYLDGRTSVPGTFDINWNSSGNPVYLNGSKCMHTSKNTIELNATQHGDLCNHCRTVTNKLNHRKYTSGNWERCYDCSYFKDLGHTHTYTYTWIDLKQHESRCSCGYNRITPHIISGNWNGQGYTACLSCGGLADSGFIIQRIDPTLNMIGYLPHISQYFGNGSFILNNGVIVLSDFDLIKLYDGTLILPHECEGLNCCYEYFDMKECCGHANNFIDEFSNIDFNSKRVDYLPSRREEYIIGQ